MRALRSRKMPLAIFALALVTRAAFIIHSHQYANTDEKTEMVAVAHALATRGQFADPFKIPTGPTAHVAPAYPLLLAAIYRPLGVTVKAEIVKESLTTAATALTYALLPLIAQAAALPFELGALAGLFGAALPIHPYMETKGEWEAPFTGAILALLVLMTLRRWRTPAAHPWRDGALRGLAWGAALQFSPVLMTVLCAFLLGELIKRRSAKPLAALLAIAALAQVPWTIRNWRAFHAFIPSRDNFGQEVFYGNHGGRYPVWEDALDKGDEARLHPNCSLSAAEDLRRQGEIAWNRRMSRQARTWIFSHPAAFIQATAEHAFYFWFPEVPLQSLYPLLWLITALSFAGLALLGKSRHPASLWIALLWLAYPLPYYLTLAEIRYALPLYWSQLLAAMYAIGWIANRIRAPRAAFRRTEAGARA